MAVNKVILNGSTIMDVSQDTVAADKLLSAFTATKNNGTKITGNIVGKSASNLTASGSTVTVPAGYYSSQVTKNISRGSVTVNGGNSFLTDSISLALTSSTGAINASYNFSSTIGATLTSGYVSSVTNGRIQIDATNTLQLTSLGATSYTPTTTSQTIPSYRWLTGTQTINAIPSAYIIPSGTSTITSNGTYSIGEYASVVVSVPKSEAQRPDAFYLAALGDLNGNVKPFNDLLQYKYGVSEMYSGSNYYIPSRLTISPFNNIDGDYISSEYTFYLSSFRDCAFAGMRFYSSNAHIVLNNLSRMSTDGLFQSCYFDNIDINSILPNISSIYCSSGFCNCKGSFGASLSGLTFLRGESVFASCTSLNYFIAPNVPSVIGSPHIFASCGGLSILSLNSCSIISGCQGFAYVTPSRNGTGCNFYFSELTAINNSPSAFAFTTANNLYMPKLSSISNCQRTFYAFAFASSISSSTLSFPNLSLIYNASEAFGSLYSNVTSVYFPSLSEIKYATSMFQSAKIKYADFPNLRSVYNSGSMFAYCSSLVNVNLPVLSDNSGCTSMFAYCSALQSITLPNAEASFDLGYWFLRCYSLSMASFPRLTSLSGYYIFSQCFNLISLFLLGSSLCTLERTVGTVFTSTPLSNYSTSAGRWGSVFVPASLLDSYKTATNWTTISSRIFAYEDYFDSNGNPL